MDLYRQLERIGRDNYFPKLPEGTPIIARLTALPALREFKEDVEYCRVVRNFLVHTPRVKNVYPVIPSDDMIKILEKCVARVKSPTMAMSFAIRRENMFTATLEHKVTNITRHMNSQGFTHVPVFEDNKLIGVFSDNVIYSCMCAQSNLHINDDTELAEFAPYIGLNSHLNEYFTFMRADSSLFEAADMFSIDSHSMKQLAVIFFTDTGRKDGKVMGMMTPYSLLRDAPEYVNN